MLTFIKRDIGVVRMTKQLYRGHLQNELVAKLSYFAFKLKYSMCDTWHHQVLNLSGFKKMRNKMYFVNC